MNVLIIGGGNMGRSFAESFLNAKILTHKQLTVIEKDHAQILELNRMKLGQVYNEFGDFISEKELIILATKPQDAYSVYPKLKAFINEKHIVLTIMAGVKISDVEKNLGTNKVIRCMPNLPCQIGMGVTGFMVSSSIPQRDADFVRKLLETTGVTIQLYDEDQLNAITAVSGSGPAYVFYFMDAMIQKTMEMGFNHTEASKMVEQTFLGAVELYKVNDLSCKEWIDKVSSKGGTTEAAVRHFNNAAVSFNIQKGMDDALQRSRDLSKN
ncbi:MAG: pyrroline-5-carboxylate reductase [Chitinophagales bacterium]|nr:pyrroline-5-carboxylate reductase [Chitinophagales bacterium]